MNFLIQLIRRLVHRSEPAAPCGERLATSRNPTHDEERARLLLIKATELKGKDWDGSISCLREAFALMARSSIVHETAVFCRLPLYLQQAGRFDEAMREFDALMESPSPFIDREFVRDKMDLARDREMRKEQKEKGFSTKLPRRKKRPDIGNDRLREHYSKQRWEAFETVAEHRPYIRMCAAGDSRDHPDCTALDGKIVLGYSEWAKANWPPHRSGCRCTTVTLSESEMARKGLTPTPTADLPNLHGSPGGGKL